MFGPSCRKGVALPTGTWTADGVLAVKPSKSMGAAAVDAEVCSVHVNGSGCAAF